jgi:hypothetical protein
LVDNLGYNVSPHVSVENWIFSTDSQLWVFFSFVFFLCFFIFRIFIFLLEWGFRAKSNSSKSVHNQVHPKQVNDSEWWSSNTKWRNENACNQTNIHCHLELDELTNILEQSSSPHNCLVNWQEIIIQNDKMSVILSNLAARTHWNTNISNFEGSCIIDAVTWHKDESSF